jgi:SAM-dependent methyltransferase
VGCGPGILTGDLLARGCRVHALEPGTALAALARSRLGADRFSLDVTTFEEWDRAGRTYDVVCSATAFHWVDPARRYALAADALRDGGALALLTNRTVAGGTFDDLYDATRELHQRHPIFDSDGHSPTTAELAHDVATHSEDIGRLWGAVEFRGGSNDAPQFAPPSVTWYEWEQSYDADSAAGLLGTFSDYLRLDPIDRAELLAGIREVAQRGFGGTVVRRYVTVLAVAARKADGGA